MNKAVVPKKATMTNTRTHSVCGAPGFRLQTKLTIGAPGDKYEQEADQAADRIMRMPDPHLLSAKGLSMAKLRVQRMCSECEEELQRQPLEEEEEETLQMKEEVGTTSDITSDISRGINELHGGGRSLGGRSRTFFEPRFGYDFSKVRIHTGERAARLAGQVRARAFTVGNHIVFGANQFAPETRQGQQLLAHELTHTIQQREAGRPHGGTKPLLQRQPIGCDAATTNVAAPRNPVREVTSAHSLARNWARTTAGQVQMIHGGGGVDVSVRRAFNFHVGGATGTGVPTIRNR